MKKPSFLDKLKGEGKLELVDPSVEICASYIEKANDCLKSAKLLLENELFEIISFAKEERIDKQYYVTSGQNFTLTKESAHDMASKAENFLVQMKLLITNLENKQIGQARENFKAV